MNKKIKILYVGYTYNRGGIETYIYNLIKTLGIDEFDFSILARKCEKAAYEDELKKIYNVKFYYEDFSNRSEIKKIYINNDFDYIHINLMGYAINDVTIIEACKRSNAKIILHSHNYINGNNSIKSLLTQKLGRLRLIRYNSKILKVACGQRAGEYLFNKYKFTIFNNGVDYNKFKFSLDNRKKNRNKYNIADDVVLYGNISKLDTQKNPLFLIYVFKELIKLYVKDNHCEPLCIFVGDGPLKDRIIEVAKALNIEKNIIFTGMVDDPSEYYSALDVFLFPSLFEGWGISLVEAQINGIKCFASDCIDKNVNISGNVKFISLKKSAEDWAKIIYNSNVKRDMEVLNKISEIYSDKYSYNEVRMFYKKHLSKYSNIKKE